MWTDCFLIDPESGRRPASDFLDSLDAKPAAQFVAIVMAVRDAPPTAFSGGGKWEAMHDEMAGFFEVRVRQGRLLHRLFCVLDRSTPTPMLLMVSGGSKATGTRMAPAVYDEARRLRQLWRDAVSAGDAEAMADCGR